MSETISKALHDAKCTSQDGTFVHASMDEVLRAVGSAQHPSGWPASLPPKREVQKLIEDFIAPDLDTEKAFASHRRSWIVQCLQALLTLASRTPAEQEDLKKANELLHAFLTNREAEIVQLRDQVEGMRECLQSIADMKEDEPREPDDADWRWRALECKRCATVTLTSTNRHPDCQGADAVCHHPACACAFPPHVREAE